MEMYCVGLVHVSCKELLTKTTQYGIIRLLDIFRWRIAYGRNFRKQR